MRLSCKQRWCVSLALRAVLLVVAGRYALTATRTVRAQPQATQPQTNLSCAVEGTPRGLRASELCKALGRELGRPTTLIDDARTTQHGDALQIIAGDVQILVVWLAEGHVRAWTRVSKIEAAADQLRFLLRATRELAKVAPALQRECVQLDPNGGRKMRSPDLTYPWADLKPCQRRLVEVVDPWWLPDAVVTPAQSPGGSP